MNVVFSELSSDDSENLADGTRERGTGTGPGGIPFSDGAPTGPFAAALGQAARPRVTLRSVRPRLEGDHVGVQAEAVIKAWLSLIDYEPPLFLAAWEQRSCTTFLLRGYVASKEFPHQFQDADGNSISFASEGGWERTPRGLERKLSATVAGPARPRLRPSAFAQADGVLVPVGYSFRGVLHVPLLGPPLAISGPGAVPMVASLVVGAALRLGEGACRAVVSDRLGALFEATGAVETFPGPATGLDDVVLGLVPELRARQDCFSDNRAANFREHALIRRGAHPPVMLLGFDRRECAARDADDHSEDGVATLVIGESDRAQRRISVSGRRAIVDAALGLPPLRLHPALLTGEELERAALLLRTETEPMPATGMPPSIERSGFAASPRPLTQTAAPINLTIDAPLEPTVEPDRKPEPVPKTPEAQSIPARRIFCLGQLRVEFNGEVIEGRFRKKSRELIALLTAYPQGILKDATLETLWPEGDPKKSDDNLRQCLTNFRKHMGAVEHETEIVDRVDELLRLDYQHVWTDVTAFQEALDAAKRSDDPEVHLREAVDLYQGDFCQGAYDWTEPFAKNLRDSFVDAGMRIAGSLEAREDLDEALEVIDRAIAADQYAEHLYRRAMGLESKRGRRDAIVERFRRLESLLAQDLGVPPGPETVGLLRKLTGI